MPDMNFDEEGFLSYAGASYGGRYEWPRNREEVVERMFREGGLLVLKQSEHNLGVIQRLETQWEDKGPRTTCGGFAFRDLRLNGKPFATVYFRLRELDGDKFGEPYEVFIRVNLGEKDEDRQFAREMATRLLENLEEEDEECKRIEYHY